MNELQITTWLKLHASLTDVVMVGRNKYQGYLNGSLLTVIIRKYPKLGYEVEAKSNNPELYSLGNTDNNLEVALDMVHWGELKFKAQ